MPRPQNTYCYQINNYNMDMKAYVDHYNWPETNGSNIKSIRIIGLRETTYVRITFMTLGKKLCKEQEERLGVIYPITLKEYRFISAKPVIFYKDGDGVSPNRKVRELEWRERMFIADRDEPYRGWVEITQNTPGKNEYKLIN